MAAISSPSIRWKTLVVTAVNEHPDDTGVASTDYPHAGVIFRTVKRQILAFFGTPLFSPAESERR